MNIPVIHYNEALASHAFAAHTALLRAERNDPTLKANPAWTMLRQEAYETFERAFERARR